MTRSAPSALFSLLAAGALTLSAFAASPVPPKKPQVTERPRPAGWEHLVPGGRFMDFFLPMPDLGGSTAATWGDPGVVPRDIRNGIEDPAWSYWGGNTQLGADGKYHLLVCRWPESAPLGHMAWKESTVVHATAPSPFGPFEVAREIGPGHNPEWFVTSRGQHLLYVIDGGYTADSPDGPWTPFEFHYDSRDRKLAKTPHHYLHNNTFAAREDGSFLMINRHGYAWFSADGIQPWQRVSAEIIYPPVEGRFEDPVVWRDHVQYHLIVNDWLGRIAWYLRSKDGVNWKVDPGEAYLPGIAVQADGHCEDWFKFERMKVLQDAHGRAYAANFAVIDTLKHSDLPHDNHSSKLITIPLTVGRLISLLDPAMPDAGTTQVRLRIQAEPGFNPHTDLDLASLRFGAPEAIDFGRGSRLLATKPAGEDLILVFDAADLGFTSDNFAGKLLGRDATGKLLFGYTRLPGVNYREPILSPRLPRFSHADGVSHANIEVQNFGQSQSAVAQIQLLLHADAGHRIIAESAVPALAPFEKTVVRLPLRRALPSTGEPDIEVVVTGAGQAPSTLRRPLSVGL